eukprot:16447039-Heterocapsa_arctica.AAC.1
MNRLVSPVKLANPSHHQAKSSFRRRVACTKRIERVKYEVLRDRPQKRQVRTSPRRGQQERAPDPTIIATPNEARGAGHTSRSSRATK